MALITEVARLAPFKSAQGFGGGQFVRFRYPTRLSQITYSFNDPTAAYNPAADSIASRIVVISGKFGDDPANVVIGYDFSQYFVLLDHYLNDPGPSTIPFFPSDEHVQVDEGVGLSILIAKAISSHAGPLTFIASVSAGSIGLGDIASHRHTRFVLGGVAVGGGAAAGGGGGAGSGGGSSSAGTGTGTGGHSPARGPGGPGP